MLMKKTNRVLSFLENKPNLTNRNLKRAHKTLFILIDFFNKEKIDYHLEGGTLLGIVRDKQLLAWDYDIDLSIMEKDAQKFANKSHKLWLKGYRIRKKTMHMDIGPLKSGQYRIFKVKKIFPSLMKEFFSFTYKHMIVADIFVKANDEKHTYWQAMRKILRVDKKYYSSYETVEYYGRELMIPYDYKGYVTKKYGDWSVPVKEWSCSTDEKTIIDEAYK